MSLLLTESAWSWQPEASGTGDSAGSTEAAPGDGGGAPPGCAGAGPQMLMLGLMFAIFYFLLIRPQQKRQRELDAMLKALRKGDKVRTTGGIRGEVLDLTDNEVTLLIADKVKINVLRSHIASRIEKSTAKGEQDKGESKDG